MSQSSSSINKNTNTTKQSRENPPSPSSALKAPSAQSSPRVPVVPPAQSPAIQQQGGSEQSPEVPTLPPPASRGSPFPTEEVFGQEPVIPLYDCIASDNVTRAPGKTTRQTGESYSNWLNRVTIKMNVPVDPRRIVPGARIRDIQDKFVKELKDNILSLG